jgi:guanyl-specific ribonuclease Sa
MARLPGMVQGVVVQITTEAPFNSGTEGVTTGNRTHMVVDV